MDFFHGHYMPNPSDRSHTWASPLHAASLAGQPPALVFTRGLDPLRDQGRAYAAKLIAHGVATRFREATGQIHGCFTLRQAIPSAQRDLVGCMADLSALINEGRQTGRNEPAGTDQHRPTKHLLWSHPLR